MFPQKERVNKTIFATVLKDGRTAHSDYLSLRYLVNKAHPGVLFNLYTFVVPGKVSKLAVTRNLLKRRGRYIIRKNKDKIKTPFICAFFFKSGSDKLDFVGLEREISIILSRAKLI